ncbi:hypothetical protein BYT27DRAFT_7158930 [Phlegmacium glaucopus]|nr:hypothetical protein BYT27DRAFT_7158930 [Phlegmacium glaucopus]
MQRTPWIQPKGSLLSDRIKPVTKSPNNALKSKGSGRQQQSSEPPKSKEVKRLESLVQAVRDATADEKDPKGGCFCLARVHSLSPYTPICRSCGLIICSVNPPQYCCPHCVKTLTTDTQRESIINQIDLQLASTVAQEVEQRQRAIEEARKVIGAFPSLSGLPVPESSISPAAQQTHKVLSFKQNNKVVISSYKPASPASKTDELEDEPDRVPPPPAEPLCSRVKSTRDRPWENLMKGVSTYIPRYRLDSDASTHQPRSHRKRQKGKKNED